MNLVVDDLGWVDLDSGRFIVCLGRRKFGRMGRAAGRDGVTFKSNSTHVHVHDYTVHPVYFGLWR